MNEEDIPKGVKTIACGFIVILLLLGIAAIFNIQWLGIVAGIAMAFWIIWFIAIVALYMKDSKAEDNISNGFFIALGISICLACLAFCKR